MPPPHSPPGAELRLPPQISHEKDGGLPPALLNFPWPRLYAGKCSYAGALVIAYPDAINRQSAPGRAEGNPIQQGQSLQKSPITLVLGGMSCKQFDAPNSILFLSTSNRSACQSIGRSLKSPQLWEEKASFLYPKKGFTSRIQEFESDYFFIITKSSRLFWDHDPSLCPTARGLSSP